LVVPVLLLGPQAQLGHAQFPLVSFLTHCCGAEDMAKLVLMEGYGLFPK